MSDVVGLQLAVSEVPNLHTHPNVKNKILMQKSPISITVVQSVQPDPLTHKARVYTTEFLIVGAFL